MTQSTLTPADAPRLLRQLDLVLAITTRNHGQWLTLDTIADLMRDGYGVRASTPSIGARLRQLRALGYLVRRQQLVPGLFGYQVTRPEPIQTTLSDIL